LATFNGHETGELKMKADDIGVLLALIAMAFFAWTLVALIKPSLLFGAKSRKKVALCMAGSAALFIVGLAIFGTNQQKHPKEATASPITTVAVQQAAVMPSPTAPAVQPAPVVAAARPLPTDEAQLIAAIDTARSAYRAAKNQMAAGGVRAERRTAICAVLAKPTNQEWIGTISQLSSSNDGKGVLYIKLSDHLVVGTSNNSFSDTGDNTLIEPGSAVFKSAVELKKGDVVAFKGGFKRDEKDCISESSMTLDGSMTDPFFLIRFSMVRKL
jgi:hypothetical protein